MGGLLTAIARYFSTVYFSSLSFSLFTVFPKTYSGYTFVICKTIVHYLLFSAHTIIHSPLLFSVFFFLFPRYLSFNRLSFFPIFSLPIKLFPFAFLQLFLYPYFLFAFPDFDLDHTFFSVSYS